MPEVVSRTTPMEAPAATRAEGPSSLYRGNLWRMALGVARALPLPFAQVLAKTACQGYRLASARRRQIVFENLLPVFGNDAQAANAATARLFSRFGNKIVDLLRFEAGHKMDQRFVEFTGWEIFERAYNRGNGVLMITPHLGNWEIGATILVDKKVKMFAVTQAEPGRGFTEMRREARARWGIDTIVVGEDAFSVIEVIRRLQEGSAVALLIDRPAAQSATAVELFGRPFQASIAPAEIARASGCAVVGGIVVEDKGGYAARFFSEFEYDRRELGNREARRGFTQEIIDGFAPQIRQYADQWYHFISVWPK